MDSTHDLIEVGKSLLIIEKNPKWKVQTAHFSILFDTDPKKVLQYGPNGLHFTEHILWCVINDHYQFQHTNAVTYGTGEMGMYGIAPSSDIEKAINGFYDAMEYLVAAKMTKSLRAIYKNEQRRVTAETYMSVESTHNPGSTSRMFTYNTDLIRSDYPPDYMWNILLGECDLQKICIIAHCEVSKKAKELFEKRAATFQSKWENRGKNLRKVVKPMFYAPAISQFRSGPSVRREETRVVSLKSIINPIERAIIIDQLGVDWCMYYLKADIPERQLKSIPKTSPKWILQSLDFSDQYFIAPILVSSGEGLTAEWIDDLHSMDANGLVKKYSKSALSELRKLIKGA